MEFGTIEREIHIDAAPEVVYEVVSSPEHIREWWGAETSLEPTPGATGELTWEDSTKGERMVVAISVVEADPPRRFSFRWLQDRGEVATSGNSLLVTFELRPSGTGTVLRLTEDGFRQMGWEAAVLEDAYQDHSSGWDTYVPAVGRHAEKLVSRT
jgi:uncharacterized protein YndB with AHSA1/START domain